MPQHGGQTPTLDKALIFVHPTNVIKRDHTRLDSRWIFGTVALLVGAHSATITSTTTVTALIVTTEHIYQATRKILDSVLHTDNVQPGT